MKAQKKIEILQRRIQELETERDTLIKENNENKMLLLSSKETVASIAEIKEQLENSVDEVNKLKEQYLSMIKNAKDTNKAYKKAVKKLISNIKKN